MRKFLYLYPLLLLVSCQEKEVVTKPVEVTVDNIDSLVQAYPDSLELLIQRGNFSIENGDFVTAMSDGAKAYRLDSTNYYAELLYAEALNNKPGRTVNDIELAQKHYHKLVLKKPGETKSWVGLAATYFQQKDLDNTYKYVNEALRIDPRCRDAYTLKGSAYLSIGNTEYAKSSYETAVQQDPEFVQAYLVLGEIYEAEGNPVAKEYYQTALNIKPESPWIKYKLAYAHQSFNELEQAKSIYRELATDTSEYYIKRALFHQAYIFQFQETNLDSAMYFYKSALKTDPTYVESWWNLGLIYAERRESTLALQSYSKAIKYAKQKEYEEDFIEAIRKDAKKEKDDFSF